MKINRMLGASSRVSRGRCLFMALVVGLMVGVLAWPAAFVPALPRAHAQSRAEAPPSHHGPAASVLVGGSAVVGLKRAGAKQSGYILSALAFAGFLGACLTRSTSATAMAATATAAQPKADGQCSDPSLTMFTNVALGEKKMELMQALSKAVATSLGKPESYVAICVKDGEDIIWGGSDDPCALCTVYSLGSINLQNNKALSASIAELMSEFGVPANRIYVNFFDIPRENCGYNGATFAG